MQVKHEITNIINGIFCNVLSNRLLNLYNVHKASFAEKKYKINKMSNRIWELLVIQIINQQSLQPNPLSE